VEGAATMKSPIIKRSVVINRHKTSISLEDAFWADLKAIASEKNTTISEPIQEEWIHEQRFGLVKRLSMMRIIARRTKAATVLA
jgi:predicted DNA-binding ribbon-helix-helix protein